MFSGLSGAAETTIAKIIKATDPQLIVLYKTDNVTITPDEFSRLLDLTTLPTVSEGANTIGQLYSKNKAFFTVGNATQQVISINEEIDASNKWYNLVNETTGKEVIKQSDMVYSSDAVRNQLEGIRTTLFFAKKPIANDSYDKFTKKSEYRDNLVQAAEVITEELCSGQYQEYVRNIYQLKTKYPDYIGNQVLLSFYLLFLASKNRDVLKKL